MLRTLLEPYIHEMAQWFEIDPHGYCYDTSPVWTNGCEAYLAKVGEAIAGFALVGPAAQWIERVGAHDVREFFVLPGFRRSGHGLRMATLIWSEHPGAWLVRVLEANVPAVLFWRTVVSSHSHGSYSEETCTVGGRRWLFFQFESKMPK